MSRKAKKAMAVALTAGMLASTAATPVMAATEGWKKNSTGWWYQNADGSWPASKWEKINGSWYYFDANGYMKANSWAQDASGKWYYLGVNGAMKVNSWAQDASGKWYFVGADGAMMANSWAQDASGKWYFLGADGAMVTNTWAKDSSNLWYYLGADGVMEAGKWITVGDKSYFLAADGVMQSGVITVEGKTYYLGAANDGSRKTGEIEIAGTKYNFGADGACTSETVPAAYKHFDKNGNEIIPEIEVEQVSDLTCEITNALSDYKEYGNVVIAGNNAYLKVLVTDSKGKPVVNTPVAIKKEHRAGAYEHYEPQSLVENTNAEGYATFVFAAKKDTTGGVPYYDIEATTPYSDELMTITATAVQINKSKKIDLSFAYVDLGDVNLNNHDDEHDSLVEVPSKNADSSSVHGMETTDSTDGNAWVEYVVSQQASDKGSTNHKVEFEVNPSLVLPCATKDGKVDEYVEEVNKEIKDYSVYHEDEDEILIKGVPAGLKYISVDFAKLDISEYTHVEIRKYKPGTKDIIDTYTIKGPTTKSDCTYTIPVQDKKTEYDLGIVILSEGQVDDDQNSGLLLTKVHGPYDSEKLSDTKSVPFGNVAWSKADIIYSNDMTLSAEEAAKYIPKSAEKYENSNYTYIYQVPAFPYVGNAIMTVKDENKKIIAYFTIPTVNEYSDSDFQNRNILIDSTRGKNKAILVSEDEAFGKEGTITQDGNKVIVNSEKTGITALQAKITVPGYEDQVNVTNDTLYTSVHWSPLPNEVVSDSEDFYALVGQDITIKAQLVDKNGNKVSQAGEEITFKYTNNDGKVDEIEKLGAIGETKASASKFNESTDANGQTTLKITSADDLAKVESLFAESAKYDVQLTIGDQTVTKATLRWVEAGLSFTDRTDKTGTPETIDTLEQTTGIDSVLDGTNGYLVKDAGTNWIFGYEVKGETQNAFDFYITGLKVDVAKGGEGTLTTTGMDNGSAKLTSSKTGVSTLTGTVNEKSVVDGTDVIFHIGDKNYKNVGEGPSTINASLNLPINWGNVGTSVSIISPKGSKLEYTSGEKAYVKVVDECGNDLNGEPVEIRVTYTFTDATTVETDVNGKTANESGFALSQTPVANGLVAVNLQNNIGGKAVKSALIVAKVGNAEPTKYTINYETVTGVVANVAIGDIVYEEQTATSNPKIRVIFTTNVNKETLRKELFTVTDSDSPANKLNVASVEVDANRQNEVIITLANTHASGLDYKETYNVAVAEYVDPVTKIEYNLCDTYFREIAKSGKFTTADTDLETARKLVSATVAADIASKEETIRNANTNDINTVAGNLGTAATGSNSGVINLSAVATNDTTVVVAEDTDANSIITVADNKVNVVATEANKNMTAVFTVKVTKGTGAQAGTASTKAYLVKVTGDNAYTVTDIQDANTTAINTDAAAIKSAVEINNNAYASGVKDLGAVLTNDTGIVVTETTDANDILTVTDGVIKVTPTAEKFAAAATAKFTVKVTKGTGNQAGETNVKTYTVTLTAADAYTVAEDVAP